MAMSSLSSQLAGLSGQTLPTSRRATDGVGRGIAHSTQQGFSVRASSSKYKPSVLHDDARAASDVPLTTLRENAVSGLNQLARLTGSAAFVSKDYVGVLAGTGSVNFERRVASKADVVQRDKLCGKLLRLLGTVWGEDENGSVISQAKSVSNLATTVTAFASGLHVLEYLLRLYEVHLYQPQILLMSVVVAHETPLFNRVLQLMDLAEMTSFVFLRPFAAPDAEVLPRRRLSKYTAGSDNLVSALCKLARDVARVHSDEVAADVSSSHDGGLIHPRMGISRVLSFVAAVLVEALDMQTMSASLAGTVKETTLRVLLPFVLGACCGAESKEEKAGRPSLSAVCPEYRSLGHILATTMVTKCPAMSSDVREVISTAIARGAVELVTTLNENGEQGFSLEAVDESTTSLLTLLSILSSESSGSSGNMPMLVSVSGDNHIGFEVPPSTFRYLTKLSTIIPVALGEILEKQKIDVSDMTASFIVRCLQEITPQTDVTEKEMKRTILRRDSALSLAIDLITETALRPLWTDQTIDLSASVSAHIVTSFAAHNDEGGVFVGDCRRILDALRSVGTVGCDIGIARAVSLLSVSKIKSGKEKGLSRKAGKRIELLIGNRGVVQQNSAIVEEQKSAADIKEEDGDGFVHLLPARVALEHPNATVRLNAIERLLAEIEETTAEDREVNGNIAEKVEGKYIARDRAVNLCHSLLRRFGADDDSGVAASSAATVRRLAAEGIVAEGDIFNDIEAVLNVIKGLLKWSVLDDVPSRAFELDVDNGDLNDEIDVDDTRSSVLANKLESLPPSDPLEAMCNALGLAGLAAAAILRGIDDESVGGGSQVEDKGDAFQTLLLLIGAHMDITMDGLGDEDCKAACARICNAAAAALIHAVAQDEESDSSFNIEEKATELLYHDENCLAILLRTCSMREDASELLRTDEKSMERRYLWACLTGMTDSIHEDDGEHDNLTKNVIAVINQILKSFEMSENTDREALSLLRHLDACFLSIINKDPSSLPAIIIELCSVDSSAAYEKVSKPAILCIFERIQSTPTSWSSVGILMEAAARHGVDEVAITRIVKLAGECVSDFSILSVEKGIANGLLQGISLLAHSSRHVRGAVIIFLSKLGDIKNKNLPQVCIDLSTAVASFKSSIKMDGKDVLPQVIAHVVNKSNSPNLLRESLLKHCLFAPRGTYGSVGERFSFGDYLGGAFSACIVLEAMKEAGENAFPLNEQWDRTGSALFNTFLSAHDGKSYSHFSDVEMHAIKMLCDCVVMMIKGVISKNAASQVVISTGPALRGGRARSYSVSAGNGMSFIDPYPADMSSSLVKALVAASERNDEPYIRLLYDTVVRIVLSSRTWTERIFPSLSERSRKDILSALLLIRSRHDLTSAGVALVSLPIGAADMSHLLKSDHATDTLGLICLIDAIRNRACQIVTEGGGFDLSSLIFERLSILSTDSLAESGYDYARVSILQALIALHEEMISQNIPLPKAKGSSFSNRKKSARKRSKSDVGIGVPTEMLASHASLLVSLLGGQDAVRPVLSSRGKALVLNLLTILCSQAPGSVVGSLIPALAQVLGPRSSNGHHTATVVDRKAMDALGAIVPAYCDHASSSGLSFENLLDAFLESCNIDDNSQFWQHSQLFESFADALLSIATTKEHSKAIASFVGALMAKESSHLSHNLRIRVGEEMSIEPNDDDAANGGSSEDAVAVSVQVLSRASAKDQVIASLQLIQYASELMEHLFRVLRSSVALGSPASETDKFSFAVRTSYLSGIAVKRSSSNESQKQALIFLANAVLSVVRDLFSHSSIKNVIRNNESKPSLNTVCLTLWQELVQLQSNALRCKAAVLSQSRRGLLGEELEFWEGAPNAAEECLNLLQRILPVPDYLASVTNLLQDEDTDAPLFVRTIELLSERASEVDPHSHESTLFLEVVPELVSILSEKSEKDAQIKQASLVAIECLVRSLCLDTGDQRVFKKVTGVVMPAMTAIVAILERLSSMLVRALISSKAKDGSWFNDSDIHLLSTAALCASTLIGVLQARCLALLPKLVKPIIFALSSINESLDKRDSTTDIIRHYKSAKISQLALLRTLVSVVETLPQFAVPYLGVLFSPTALPSRSLRQGDSEEDSVVRDMADRLDRALATKTPARQLIPIASQAVGNCLGKKGSGDWQEAKALLFILKTSVESTVRSELSPSIGKLLNALLLSFDYDSSDCGQRELLSSVNQTLLALVMKISEAQLRPLYARIREWRGELELFDADGHSVASATRRYAFWSMSALFSKELRSIFLPCLSSVLIDAIKELEMASSFLCGPSRFSENAGGDKRRRLDSSSEITSHLSLLKPLQPILLCLESALKADAHEGGNWIRSDDGQRHNLILEPLGKLLQANIPDDYPVETNLTGDDLATISSYQKLVQGTGTLDYGSVASCITALTMAAGDEQMWKPINHAILQACGNEDKAHIRKAAVACLHSVMESVGEEYMVLLPECLPTLSELLEDEDEEIAGLARECVTLGEELLGESLEDSLR